MPNKVTIISQDYDNCYSIMTSDGFLAEFNGRNRNYWAKKAVDKMALTAKTREKYNAYLTVITRDATRVQVYDGSDRQSYLSDQVNIAHNGNGSVFPALEGLCRDRNTPRQPWLFEHLLMADPLVSGTEPFLRERGMAYQRILAGHPEQLSPSDKPTVFINKDGRQVVSKRPMLLNQLWDAYRQNSDATELEFHFIDDKQDLIDDVLGSLNPLDMPPNVTLIVSKFDYIGVLGFNDPTALAACGTIVSARTALRIPVYEEPSLPAETKTDPNGAYAKLTAGSSLGFFTPQLGDQEKIKENDGTLVNNLSTKLRGG